jgi:nucleotide-binding universal stress UspA family protein
LLPIEIANCPFEVLEAVGGFAGRPDLTVILLHVVNLNIASPENRIYDELCREAHGHLHRLAHIYLRQIPNVVLRVRAGEPEEEILAEAAEQKVDMIMVPSRGPSWWERASSVLRRQPAVKVSRAANKIVRKAACAVFIVRAKTRFNCRKAWGRQGPGPAEPYRHPRAIPASEISPVASIEDPSIAIPSTRLAA